MASSALSRKLIPVATIGGALLLSCWFLPALRSQGDLPTETSSEPSTMIDYPETRRGEVVDTYHGVEVADPYRWLEDPNSEETAAWVAAQNEVTFGYLEQIPQRDSIRQRLTHLWDYERFGVPEIAGDRYLYNHNDGLQNQSVLLVADSLDGEPRVLLDPNTFSEDGTISLAGTRPDKQGNLLAYGTSDGGSDWRIWKFVDIATGEHLTDELHWIRNGGVSWDADGEGVYYSRYPEPEDDTEIDQGQRIFYHQLGTPQSEDRLIYERPDYPEWTYSSWVTEDGRYLMIHVSRGTLRKNQIFYRDLQEEESSFVELLAGFDWAYYLLGNDGPVFYFMTDDGAPRWRIIATDVTQPDRANWREVVPEREETLSDSNLFGDVFLSEYIKDATSLVRRDNIAGESLGELAMPGLGSAGGFSGHRDQQETFYYYTDYSTPACIYRFDLQANESTLFKAPEVDIDPTEYETRQVFYESKDGTQVPMFITHKRGLVLDGSNPTLLYGYGGFNVSLSPGYSTTNQVWLEMGGVFVVANLRGGGEYGREWHEAGTIHNKQNVFDDFIAAAEWLIENDYTSSEHLAIQGGSNGGLLVGACTTQRPDLYAAALPAVGVMDMLRYHQFTIGWMWASDYGTSDDAEHFATLHAYSPLHNIEPNTRYPATMVTTADHDDRVVPAHSFKYAATLQAAQAGEAPVLIRIDVRAGHGAGTPTSMRIAEATDRLAFLVKQLGVTESVESE